jgi:hypothetical protein
MNSPSQQDTMAKGDICSGTLSAKEISELKTLLASVLTKLDKLDKLEISYRKLENKLEGRDRESRERHEALLNKIETSHRELGNGLGAKLEASHRKTLAISDKAIESFKITSPQIGDQEKVSDQELQPDVEIVDLLENGQIDLADESQIMEFSNPEHTDVILRRQGEHAISLLEEWKQETKQNKPISPHIHHVYLLSFVSLSVLFFQQFIC